MNIYLVRRQVDELETFKNLMCDFQKGQNCPFYFAMISTVENLGGEMMEFDWVYIGMFFSCAVITFLPAYLITKFVGKKFFCSSFNSIKNWSVMRYGVHLAIWSWLFVTMCGLVMKI